MTTAINNETTPVSPAPSVVLEHQRAMTFQMNHYVHSAERKVKEDLQALRKLALYIQRRMDEVIEKIDMHGPDAPINGLGELQYTGLEFDRCCSAFVQHREMLYERGSLRKHLNDHLTAIVTETLSTEIEPLHEAGTEQ